MRVLCVKVGKGIYWENECPHCRVAQSDFSHKGCQKKKIAYRGYSSSEFITGHTPQIKKVYRKSCAKLKPLKELVFIRDGYRCINCGSDEFLTLDHLIPRSKGGKHKIWNLGTMCEKCNGRKADHIIQKWVDLSNKQEQENQL